MTRSIIHRANTRGLSNLSWMKSFHSFSFGQYFNPIRMQFGKLRVLNDERIMPNRGFSSTPLDNMEMVTIVMNGKLLHRDSLGNHQVLTAGSVQCLTSGKGIKHSEMNDGDEELRLIHLRFLPKEKGFDPKYSFCNYDLVTVRDELLALVTPDQTCSVAQDVYVYWGNMKKDKNIVYKTHDPNNGIYLISMEGMIQMVDHVAFASDAIGAWPDGDDVEIKMMSDAKFLLIEVPPKR
ncbi:pirin family protein [Halosquirtibacter xylanolyticus]|uniref:pirin family protein n=1 Tax=Halosquirtibacter xylanolyticus TaxID=3374599 RepID=UPI00374A3609|nr:pirin family protein [Prolixibacteraceae bacterium]